MNDETRQMQKKLFDHIVLSIMLLGMVSALSTLLMSGYSSPWFFRALALIIVALVAFGLRRVSQFVVAAYVLIIELLGITTAIFLQSDRLGVVSYLFIPVVIIAGLLLSPAATLILAALSILIILLVLILTNQLSTELFIALLPPFSLITITALLVIEGRRYVEKLGERLLESRTLLRARTLEMMEAQDTIAELQHKAQELKQQLLNNQGAARQIGQRAQQKNEGLYELIKGSIQELDSSVEDLECLIDSISENTKPAEQADALEKIWQKIYHLNSLVVNLEDMAQLKNEQVILNYQEVDIAQLIRDVVGTTRGLARGKNLEIRCQIPDDLPQMPLDPTRFRQALLYILNNALKYTDQGIIEVQAEMNTEELLIFVSDTGIGMRREEMDLVFQEFSRGSGTLAQQRQGTGLGLALSRGLVELHGGRMWVTSVLGVGSTFYINLPLKRPAAVPVVMGQPEPEPVTSVPVPPMTAIDPEKTVSSAPPPANGKPHPAPKPAFGSPVGRFSPTYIGRLVFIALGVLMFIASAVAILAAFYGPVSQDEGTATVSAAVHVPATATGEKVAVIPTYTPQPTSTTRPTATPFNTPTSTAMPADTQVPPADTQVPPADTPVPPADTPVPPADTPVPPTHTSASTTTPTEQPPTSLPLPSATLPPTATSTVRPTVPASGADAGQINTQEPVRELAVVADSLLALRLMSNSVSHSVNAFGALVPDSNVSWSPQGERVLFTSAREGNYEIYMANADGSKITNLTRSDGYDTHPAWSPNGRTIAFSSQRGGNVDIYTMDTTGGNIQPLTSNRGYEEWPVWSPDGRKIAFISDRDGNNEIYVMNADGSHQQRITTNPADDWPAAWSPDGNYLVFSSNRSGNWNLYVIDLTGGQAQQLTDDPADERDPVWSPGGAPGGGTIAFVSNAPGNWDVFTLPAPGGSTSIVPKSQWTQLTKTPTIDERYPTWKP